MKTGQITIISAVSVALLYSLTKHFSHRKQNQLARTLIVQLEQYLNPDSAGLLAEDGFDIYYLEKLRQHIKGTLILLHNAAASRYAKDIQDSFSIWGDDEQRIFGVFRSLKDKVQLSQVASAYQSKYKTNLIDVLSDNLSQKEISTILSITGNLPNYRTR